MSLNIECAILDMASELTGDEFKLLFMLSQSAGHDVLDRAGYDRAISRAGFTQEQADIILGGLSEARIAIVAVVPPYIDENAYRICFKIFDPEAEKTYRRKHNAEKALKRRDVTVNYDRLFVAIGRRDGFLCRKCKAVTTNLQIDHVIPISKGGTNELDNLQLLCPPCNLTKSDRLEA